MENVLSLEEHPDYEWYETCIDCNDSVPESTMHNDMCDGCALEQQEHFYSDDIPF